MRVANPRDVAVVLHREQEVVLEGAGALQEPPVARALTVGVATVCQGVGIRGVRQVLHDDLPTLVNAGRSLPPPSRPQVSPGQGSGGLPGRGPSVLPSSD